MPFDTDNQDDGDALDNCDAEEVGMDEVNLKYIIEEAEREGEEQVEITLRAYRKYNKRNKSEKRSNLEGEGEMVVAMEQLVLEDEPEQKYLGLHGSETRDQTEPHKPFKRINSERDEVEKIFVPVIMEEGKQEMVDGSPNYGQSGIPRSLISDNESESQLEDEFEMIKECIPADMSSQENHKHFRKLSSTSGYENEAAGLVLLQALLTQNGAVFHSWAP